MRFQLLACALALPISAWAAAYEYDVQGYCDGEYVYGEIEVNCRSKEVEGYLYHEDGNAKHFEGGWTGYGEIEGYDEDGNFCELEVEQLSKRSAT